MRSSGCVREKSPNAPTNSTDLNRSDGSHGFLPEKSLSFVKSRHQQGCPVSDPKFAPRKHEVVGKFIFGSVEFMSTKIHPMSLCHERIDAVEGTSKDDRRERNIGDTGACQQVQCLKLDHPGMSYENIGTAGYILQLWAETTAQFESFVSRFSATQIEDLSDRCTGPRWLPRLHQLFWMKSRSRHPVHIILGPGARTLLGAETPRT